jgi:UDPglucose 6-dehydrogenase
VGRGIREKKEWHLVVLTSTVLPGATRHALVPALEEASGKRCGKDFGVCYSPAFIALGTVIRDFLNPDLVIVGESDERSGAALEALYREILENDAPVRRMSMENAELAKLGVNTFVTTKIAFANMLADLCERIPGGDVDVVTGALGLDRRIGRPYLTGGLGYGGPCFPRDNQALSFLARSLGTTALLAETTDRMNREIPARLMARIDGEAGPGKTVAVLGLAYKPGTSVIEESQAVLLARSLAQGGATVRAYDPLAGEPVRAELEPEVRVTASLQEAVHDADLILVCTPDERFRELPLPNGRSRHVTIVDCWRLLAGQIPAVSATVRYLPVGRSPEDLTRSERLASLWEGATAVPASSNGSPAVENTPSESALQNGRGQ